MRRVNPRIDIIMRNPVINNNSATYDLFSHNIRKQKAEIKSLSSFLAVNLCKTEFLYIQIWMAVFWWN